MEFDLFKAMIILRKNFGDNATLILSQDDVGMCIKINLYQNNEVYAYQFIVTWLEMSSAEVSLLNYKFQEAIDFLK